MSTLSLLAIAVSALPTLGAPDANGVGVSVLSVMETRFADLQKKDSKQSSMFSFSSFGMENENALRITIELQGEAITNATHFGKIKLSKATDDTGKTLSLHENFKVGMSELAEQFAKIDRNMMYFSMSEAPKDRIKVDLKFEKPSRKATKIKTMQGSVSVRTGTPQDVTIDSIKAMAGKKLSDKALEQAGIQITVVDPKKAGGFFSSGKDDGMSVALQVAGELDALLEMDLVDANGTDLNASTMWSTSGSTAEYTLIADEKLPATTKLKVQVSVGAKTIDVPFSINNLTLP